MTNMLAFLNPILEILSSLCTHVDYLALLNPILEILSSLCTHVD